MPIRASFPFAKQYLGLSEEGGYIRGMLRGAATAVCQTVIFQMQDLLALGDEGRMNRPGQAEGNWQWRMLPDQLTLELASSLKELTRMERPPILKFNSHLKNTCRLFRNFSKARELIPFLTGSCVSPGDALLNMTRDHLPRRGRDACSL